MNPVNWTTAIGSGPTVALTPLQHILANALCGGGAIVSLLFVLYIAIKHKTSVPILLYVCAVPVSVYEIWVNVVGRCIWAAAAEPIIFRAMGREMPAFHLLVYLFYFPVAGTLVWMELEKGLVTQRRWWKWLGIMIPVAALFELYPVNNYWWFYYGDAQPLTILAYPVWWPSCAMLAVFGSTGVVYMLTRFLGRQHTWWLILFIFPLVVVSLHMFAAYAVFMALSTPGASLMVTSAAAAFTIGASLWMLWLIGRVLEDQQKRQLAK